MNTPEQVSLVTGGGGFVGRVLVQALRARGDRVIVVEPHGEPWRDDIEFARVDIRDTVALTRLCEGVDTVFHNASLVHTKQSREDDVWSVNLGGARSVLRACWEARVRKLVYVSTASAVYEGRDIENGDESLPYSRKSQAAYADSKIAAEREVLAANGQRGVLTCAIRPHVIFGSGDKRFIAAVLDKARAGRLRLSVGIANHKLSDFTYVDNLVDALLLADERLTPGSAVAGQAYFITNGEPMPFFEFVKRMLRELDLPRIVGAVPYPIAYAAAAIKEGIDTLRGGTLHAEGGMSRFAVRYMVRHHYFDISKARRDLGYVPRVGIDEGIRRTCAELRQRGLA
ncbi:MAG: 3-beta hydroxysteroid dehydrogenase/isomerase family protein [Myxococcaceae bacterium]|nr:3-beta hydroxysteroid dehydrogenase/isomerase family protein [Myxococcaceae bacterium]